MALRWPENMSLIHMHTSGGPESLRIQCLISLRRLEMLMPQGKTFLRAPHIQSSLGPTAGELLSNRWGFIVKLRVSLGTSEELRGGPRDASNMDKPFCFQFRRRCGDAHILFTIKCQLNVPLSSSHSMVSITYLSQHLHTHIPN